MVDIAAMMYYVQNCLAALEGLKRVRDAPPAAMQRRGCAKLFSTSRRATLGEYHILIVEQYPRERSAHFNDFLVLLKNWAVYFHNQDKNAERNQITKNTQYVKCNGIEVRRQGDESVP
jgi:hypothetical protein